MSPALSRARLPLVVACLAAVLLALGVFGCAGAEPADDAAEEAVSSAAEEQHQDATVRVAAPASLQGVLGELESAYAADRDWVTFEHTGFPTSAKLNAQIAPGLEEPEPDSAFAAIGALASSTSSSGQGESSSSPSSPTAVEPLFDIVFEDSVEAMNVVELAGVIDLGTRVDLLEDRLALVVAEESPITSVSLADLQAGSFRIAVADAETAEGALQREVLASSGLYADGAFAGALAEGEAAEGLSTRRVFDVADAEGAFQALAKNGDLVAIVRTSDLYRFGGVKVVGEVPPGSFTPPCYPVALWANLDAMENGTHVREAALDFIRWITTDPDAKRIVAKWGFAPVA